MFGILGMILFKNRFGYCGFLKNFEVHELQVLE